MLTMHTKTSRSQERRVKGRISEDILEATEMDQKMNQRVESALKAVGLSDKYLVKFKAQEMNDEMVESCLQSSEMLPFLNEIIPILAHRIKFIKEFSKTKVKEPTLVSEDSACSTDNKMKRRDSGDFEFIERSDEEKSYSTASTTSLEIEPHAVQVVKLLMEANQDKSQFILDIPTLESILEKSPADRPLAVVSIVGSSQKGKSSFLNYALRFLKDGFENGQIKPGKNDWIKMEWTTQHEPLEGFPWATKINDRVTNGLWMWSEPFTVKSCSGQEFDILLMDTQALFDDYSNPHDWPTIMGLCLLLSSSIIFNVGSEQLNEERLHFLQKVLTHLKSIQFDGQEEENNSNEKKLLQKITFLLRDWTNIQNFPCGHEGGYNFIRSKLEIKDNHLECHRRSRQILQDSFEQIDCCLLPPPGHTARQSNFQGAISCLDLKYAIKLEQSIMNIFNPESLPIKKICGQQITAGSFLQLLQYSIDTFNNQSICMENSMTMSMSSIMFKEPEPVNMQNLIDIYNDEISKKAGDSSKLIPLEEVDANHKAAANSTLTNLDNFTSKDRTENLVEMVKLLEGMFMRREEANEKYILEAQESGLKQFALTIELNESSTEEFIEDEKLGKVLAFAEKEAKRRFSHDLVPSTLGSIETVKEHENFDKLIQKEIQLVKEANKQKLIQIKEKLSKMVEQTKKNYKTEMLVKVEGKIFMDDQLNQIHSQVRKRQVDSFEEKQEELKINSKMFKDFITRIEISIDQDIFPSIEKKNIENYEMFQMKARNSMAEASTLYSRELRNFIKDSNDEGELVEKEGSIKQRCLTYLETKINEHGGNSMKTFNEQLLQEFMEKMTSEFEMNLQFFRVLQAEDELAVREALLEISNFYNEEMEKQFQSKDFLLPGELMEYHKEISKEAFDYCPDDLVLTDKQKNKLEKAMESLFLKYKEENLRRLPQDAPAVGIDLGTTCSCVAVYINGQVTIIRNENESSLTTTPSYVSFDKVSGTPTVGEAAKRQSCRNPFNTIYDAKRLIGRKFSDKSVQEDMKNWYFNVINAENDQPEIKVENKTYRPEEISARVLRHMQTIAEYYLQKPVRNVVVTVPANFNDGQRQATKDAAEIAGLRVMKIINEPTAAALAHHHIILKRNNNGQKRNVIVFDLGGGTFDVAVLTIEGGQVDVKACSGDMHLGGEDFDKELASYCIEYVKQNHGIDLTFGQQSKKLDERFKVACTLRRLRNDCEKAKCNLSAENCLTTEVEIDVVDSEMGSVSVPITRDLFNELNKEYFKNCLDIVERVLNDAGILKTKIDDIVLVGGSTRIPKVQQLLKEFFGNKTLSVHREFNPDEAVAYGAAIQAALLNGEQAASQLEQIKFSDVSPLPIGIQLIGDKFDKIVPRNTKIPYSITKYNYGTTYDYQTSCTIAIYEGEDPIASQNHLLGKFLLDDIPPSRAGKEPIDVTMNISDEGILHVTAICPTNKTTNDLKILEFKKRMTDQEKREARDGMELYK